MEEALSPSSLVPSRSGGRGIVTTGASVVNPDVSEEGVVRLPCPFFLGLLVCTGDDDDATRETGSWDVLSKVSMMASSWLESMRLTDEEEEDTGGY